MADAGGVVVNPTSATDRGFGFEGTIKALCLFGRHPFAVAGTDYHYRSLFFERKRYRLDEGVMAGSQPGEVLHAFNLRLSLAFHSILSYDIITSRP